MIIPKSEASHRKYWQLLKVIRVLLATLRQDGFCCCIRCEAEKAEIRLLGTSRDKEIRAEKLREDSERRRRLIRKARKLIYEKGLPVNSKKVEDLLRAASLVPTEVPI